MADLFYPAHLLREDSVGGDVAVDEKPSMAGDQCSNSRWERMSDEIFTCVAGPQATASLQKTKMVRAASKMTARGFAVVTAIPSWDAAGARRNRPISGRF